MGAFELCSDLIEVVIRGNKVPIVEKDSFIGCQNLERFYNDLGDIDIKLDFRISNTAFSTCYKLINNQNKWLMTIQKEEKNIFKIINKILYSIGKLFKANGMENIKSKF